MDQELGHRMRTGIPVKSKANKGTATGEGETYSPAKTNEFICE